MSDLKSVSGFELPDDVTRTGDPDKRPTYTLTIEGSTVHLRCPFTPGYPHHIWMPLEQWKKLEALSDEEREQLFKLFEEEKK